MAGSFTLSQKLSVSGFLSLQITHTTAMFFWALNLASTSAGRSGITAGT